MPADIRIDQGALDGILGRLIRPWLEDKTTQVADQAKTGAPRGDSDGPHLADSIVSRVEGTSASTLRGVVTATRPYAKAVHDGARPHLIVPRRARVLRFPAADGTILFRPRVNHPGNQPNPFLRDALARVFGG